LEVVRAAVGKYRKKWEEKERSRLEKQWEEKTMKMKGKKEEQLASQRLPQQTRSKLGNIAWICR